MTDTNELLNTKIELPKYVSNELSGVTATKFSVEELGEDEYVLSFGDLCFKTKAKLDGVKEVTLDSDGKIVSATPVSDHSTGAGCNLEERF